MCWKRLSGAKSWLLLGLLAVGQSASAGESWQAWLKRQIWDRTQIDGYRRLGYHIVDVSGDNEAFSVQNYSGFGGKRFTDIGQLQLTGRRVLGLLNFDATILDSRFSDPQNQRFSIDFERNGFSANLGDVNSSLLNTNRFASFSRNIRGVQLGYKAGNFRMKAVRSQAKGSARAVTINGNNSPGPYYLQASQIIADSETVKVDGETLRRGTDYIISYEAGSITFVDRTISPSSTITVAFEAFGINTRLGNLDGVGLSYDAGKGGRLSITSLSQKARGSDTSSTRLEKFFGFGAPSTPYSLQFEPLKSEPIVIRVNGALQTEGVDYFFDSLQPSIFYFTRFMAATDEIDVVYTPKPTDTVNGDREVLGIDYRLPISDKGYVQWNTAHGKLKSLANPTSGNASSLEWRLDLSPKSKTPENPAPVEPGKPPATTFKPTLTFDGGFRDVSPGYVSIDSRSFNRNEKATDFVLRGNLSPKTQSLVQYENSRITTRVLDSQGNFVVTPSRISGLSLSQKIGAESSSPWNFDASRRRAFTNGNASNLDVLGITKEGQYSKGSYKWGIQRQQGRGPTTSSAGSPQQGFSLTGLVGRADWLALNRQLSRTVETSAGPMVISTAETLRFDGRLELNAISGNGKRGNGYLSELSAGYQRERFSMDFLFSANDTGPVNALGAFDNGTGTGIVGSGFTNGSLGGQPLGASSARTVRLSSTYRPSDPISVFFDATIYRASGGLSSNSETRSYGGGLNWDLGQHRLSVRGDFSSTSFTGSLIKSNATNIYATLDGLLGPRWNYALRGSLLVTGGGSTFKQNGGTFEGSLGYLIDPRQSLSLDWATSGTSGFRPQNDLGLSLTYAYRVWQQLSLNASYRLRDVRNLDSGASGGAYRFGAFDFVLSFDFGR